MTHEIPGDGALTSTEAPAKQTASQKQGQNIYVETHFKKCSHEANHCLIQKCHNKFMLWYKR